MLDTIWSSLGLVYRTQETITMLRDFSSRRLLGVGIFLSLLAMSSYFLGVFLQNSTAPYILLFELLSYYIGSFLFLSVILTILVVFYRKTDIVRFLGIYLMADMPLFLILPLSFLSVLLPSATFVVGLLTTLLILKTFILKIISTSQFFQLTFPQVFLLYLLPCILILIWGISGVMVFVNQLATIF